MRCLPRRAVLAGLASLALPLCPARAGGQEPPLRIVFPYAPGGPIDAMIRLIADHLHKALGRTVLVENKSGAGGAIGVQAVRHAGDGNTILLAAAAQFTLQPHVLANLGYDPFADFVPISQIITFDQAVTVGPQIPAETVEALAAWMQAAPERTTFGTPGEGTGAHFAGLAFGQKFGLSLSHVPYRGTQLALPDLISGRLPLYIASTAGLTVLHRRGEIRILATAGKERSAFLPYVPTLQERGVDIDAPGWFGLYAPAHTPPERVAQLESAIMAAMQSADARAMAEAVGFQPTGTSAAELARIQRTQFERWGAVVKAFGFKTQ